MRALDIIKSAAQMFMMDPTMPWAKLEQVTLYLRLVKEGQECPSLDQFLQFLSSIPYEHSRELFMAIRFLMETMTSQGVPFREVMESFIRMDNDQKLHQFDNDVPPPNPHCPPPVYSLDLWRLVKQVSQFQSSLRPVTRSVLSSRMMVSPSARYGFYLRSVLHRSNPSLRLVTVSPGMLRLILRKILTNAARSGQNCHTISGKFKTIYCLKKI